MHFLTPICTKWFVTWGFALDPNAYSAPPDPLAVFRGPTCKGSGSKRGRVREFVVCPRKKKRSRRLWLVLCYPSASHCWLIVVLNKTTEWLLTEILRSKNADLCHAESVKMVVCSLSYNNVPYQMSVVCSLIYIVDKNLLKIFDVNKMCWKMYDRSKWNLFWDTLISVNTISLQVEWLHQYESLIDFRVLSTPA